MLMRFDECPAVYLNFADADFLHEAKAYWGFEGRQKQLDDMFDVFKHFNFANIWALQASWDRDQARQGGNVRNHGPEA